MYYQESGHNYGLTGREHTPLRALAAYAAAIRFLRGKTYIGDLPNKDGANGESTAACTFICNLQVNPWAQFSLAGAVVSLAVTCK